MRFTLANKIFLALTLASVVVLAVNAVTTRWNFQKGFLEYVSAKDSQILARAADGFAAVYEQDGSWQRLRDDRRLFDEVLRRAVVAPGRDGTNVQLRPPREPRRPPPRDGRGRPGHRPPPDILQIGGRIQLLDVAGVSVSGPPRTSEINLTQPVTLNGQVIATLTMAPQQFLTDQADQQFANEQTRYIFLSAAAAILFAALVAGVLSRHLTKPLQKLSEGAQAIAAGEYETRLDAVSDDEFGELANEFNILSQTLERNRESRQQWVADIAHELRTPLSILQGELHAIEDGVREFDKNARVSLQHEVSRLTQLVKDLHDLSSSDEGGLSYKRNKINLNAMLQESIEKARTRLEVAGLHVQTRFAPEAATVFADDARMQQLVTNLIENSLRYTDTPGTILFSTNLSDNALVFEVADSAPGVPNEALPRLFERLYRVDTSRNRETGGSGLGLSICRAIVDAHGGEISAHTSHIDGLLVRVVMPLAKAERTLV